MDNRIGASIDAVNFTLIHEGSSLDLHGKTLEEGMVWLGDRLGHSLKPREYDMPPHAVAGVAAFQPNDDHLQAVARWYTIGQFALQNQGELRIWPHHFDLGFVKTGFGEIKGIGGGFSPGDDHFPLPYI
jgi:hypothetical protein